MNQIYFYNEIGENIKHRDFLNEHLLSGNFIVTSTFEEAGVKDQLQEFVATIEGKSLPFFGIAYSIERHQFNIDMAIQSNIDTGKLAI